MEICKLVIKNWIRVKIQKSSIMIMTFLLIAFSCGNPNKKTSNNNNLKSIDLEKEESYVRLAIEVAQESKTKGDLPFGCVLVSKSGEIL